MATPADFRNVLDRAAIGDTLRLEIARSSGRKTVTVIVTGYDRAVVRILPDSNATARQKRRRAP